LEDLDIDRRIILKCLRKGVDWMLLVLDRDGGDLW
jgi:hypothetical protein